LAYILLIDQDLASVYDIQPVLAQEGYHVEHALPGPLAFRKAVVEQPDLVIAGIRPENREWQFCRRLLSVLDSPLFLLLANAGELDRVKALDLGADECMIKPVLLVEMVARVRTLLRRAVADASFRQRSCFVDGDLFVDLTRRQVQVDDDPILLTSGEFRILSCLVNNEGLVVSHQQLCTQIFGPQASDAEHNVRPYICNLRRKIEPDPHHPQRIVTCQGEGYMLKRIAPNTQDLCP
jgi:two-component system KDP operon response regulator KdpE